MGAPRRKGDTPSSVLLTVRVTPGEREAIRKAARREDLTMSEYLRVLALPPAAPRPRRSA